MSQDKGDNELTRILWEILKEAQAVRARVDKLANLARRLNQVTAGDTTAAGYVDAVNRGLERADSHLRDLLSYLRPLDSQPPAGEEQTGAANVSQAKKKVLVIDDEASVVNLVERILTAQGYEVDTACDGVTGIGMVNARFYDLVMLDLKMPEMAGTEVYHHIEAENPAQAHHVVFFSGDVVSPRTTEFLRRTGRPFLVKPFTIQELVTFVRRALS